MKAITEPKFCEKIPDGDLVYVIQKYWKHGQSVWKHNIGIKIRDADPFEKEIGILCYCLIGDKKEILFDFQTILKPYPLSTEKHEKKVKYVKKRRKKQQQ